MRTKALSWICDALLAVGYAVVFYALLRTAHVFWYLPAGWRFVALLCSPYYRWPWFVAAEILIFLCVEPAFRAEYGWAAVWILLANDLAVIGPLWLSKRKIGEWGTPAAMAAVLAAMLLAALGATLGNQAYPFAEAARMSSLRLGLQLVLGDYIGMLALAPMLWMASRDRPPPWIWHRWRFEVSCVLLPALALYTIIVVHAGEMQVFFFSVLLCLVPAIYFATRTGWRGATLALCASSMAVACSGIFAGHEELTVEAQGFLAVAGSAILLLGAAYDNLREHQSTLHGQNAALLAANTRLDKLAGDLREAAQRNLDTAEQTRRWITSELHDEIGQNLTALQTRIRLLERQVLPAGNEMTAEIGGILAHMRRTVSGLLSDLRPAGLNEFGLAHALREGAIRSLIESNGITCDTRIDDPAGLLDRLDDSASTTLYRIAQEAATNTVRHAGARRFRVCLRTRESEGGDRVLLIIDDDGAGFATGQRTTGIGLQGIRDRVLSLGGRLRLCSSALGTRIQVQLRFRNM